MFISLTAKLTVVINKHRKMMSGGISDGKMNQLNEFQYVHAQITQAPPQIIYGNYLCCYYLFASQSLFIII